jgi:hypothetical protein
VKRAAHREYLDYIENAWRDDNGDRDDKGPSGTGKRGAVREGASCTIDGRSGTMVMIDDVLTCVAADRQDDAAAGFKDAREASYAAYDNQIRDAWRNPSA